MATSNSGSSTAVQSAVESEERECKGRRDEREEGRRNRAQGEGSVCVCACVCYTNDKHEKRRPTFTPSASCLHFRRRSAFPILFFAQVHAWPWDHLCCGSRQPSHLSRHLQATTNPRTPTQKGTQKSTQTQHTDTKHRTQNTDTKHRTQNTDTDTDTDRHRHRHRQIHTVICNHCHSSLGWFTHRRADTHSHAALPGEGGEHGVALSFAWLALSHQAHTNQG